MLQSLNITQWNNNKPERVTSARRFFLRLYCVVVVYSVYFIRTSEFERLFLLVFLDRKSERQENGEDNQKHIVGSAWVQFVMWMRAIYDAS